MKFKNYLIVLFLLPSFFVLFAKDKIKIPNLSPREYKEGEILVKYKENASSDKKSALVHGKKHLGTYSMKGKAELIHIKLSKDESVETTIADLKNDPDVEFAEPNYIRKAFTTTPNDPNFNELWGLKNSAQTISSPSYTTNNPGTTGMDMNLQNAWDIHKDCSNTIVAVLDSGMNYNHEDLSSNLWDGTSCKDETGATKAGGCPNHGWDFVDNDNNPMDIDGHGTHVAGTIGAKGNNGTGSTGVCWNVKLMAVRILGPGGGSVADEVKGIQFAVHNGAKVINMSLGSSNFSQTEMDAITFAKNNDVVVVVAAGNSNEDLSIKNTYPCEITTDNLICVAALDQSYSLATFSNYDSAKVGVDVGAPGTNISSTWAGTEATITDDFSTGWIYSNVNTNWGVSNCLIEGASYPVLGIPNTCSKFSLSGSYNNSTNSKVYKSFSIDNTVSSIILETYAIVDLEPSSSGCFDTFYLNYKATSGDPFASGLNLDSGCGTFLDLLTYNLSSCIGQSTCSIGFRVASDDSINFAGVGILDFSIKTMKNTTNVYKTIDGTSMATPHVAGVTALVRSYNPTFTYTDAINAIVKSGNSISSLSSTTKYGKAVDADKALKYINAPINVNATVQ